MRTAAIILAALTLLACEGKKETGPVERVRPVSVHVLTETNPSEVFKLTGSVEPHRRESIAFEVGGRLLFVRDVGEEVEGTVFDEAGNVIREGDVIAEIDPEMYTIARDTAKSRLTAAEKSQEAQVIDLEKVARLDLERAESRQTAAESERQLAAQELERERNLLARGASTQTNVDNAQTRFDAADANATEARTAVLAAKAALELKKAQLEATVAEIDQLVQALRRAERDLEETKLRAPFNGRITVRHASRGGFVQPGAAVVELTLFDPIRVAISVSATRNRLLNTGDPVAIYPRYRGAFPDAPRQMIGVVFKKEEVADPATRTFRIEVIVRNPQMRNRGMDLEGTSRAVTMYFPAIRMPMGEGPLFVNTGCFLERGGKTFVLKVPHFRFGEAPDEERRTSFRPELVEVTPRDQYRMFLRWSCREIVTDVLQEGDLLLMNPEELLDESGEPVEVLTGDYTWALLPGDLVSVDLDLGKLDAGLYAPLDSIVTRNGNAWVFTEKDGRVKRVDVEVGEQFRDTRVISSADLSPGDRIVVDGRHYVRDGDTVKVVAVENE